MNSIKILDVPFEFGQPHSGVKFGGAALRDFGLYENLSHIARVKDLGQLDFSLLKDGLQDHRIKKVRSNSLGNELISRCIESESLEQSFLLNVGGDHGMGLGTVHGMLGHHADTIVIWADAHGDMNTPESSPTGNFHGMPLSFLLSIGQDPKFFRWIKYRLKPQKLIFFGPRDLDPEELKFIGELGIQYYSSRCMNTYGTEVLLQEALRKADPSGRSPVHLSFDVDVFDGEDVQATGTRVMEGPRVEEVLSLGALLGRTGRLRSMDVVEVNPEIGSEREVARTLALTCEMIEGTLEGAFSVQRIRPKAKPELGLSA